MPACQDCGRLRWPPRPSCPSCQSLETGWTTVSGRGRIFTWIVIHRTTLEEYRDATPYMVAVVELAECAACHEQIGSRAPAETRELCRQRTGHQPIRMIALVRDSGRLPASHGQPVELQFTRNMDGELFPVWRTVDPNAADQGMALKSEA